MGLAKAFAHFGAAGKNQRWSWSARSVDGKVIVLALWKDQFNYTTKPPRYHATSDATNSTEWLKRPGNNERLENLIWAEENCGGQFHVVVIEAVDPDMEPRKIKTGHPSDRMIGQIIKLNRDTGEFEAKILDREE